MAVPQLQLANLGEIYAQNQAKQAAMDTMQLEQAAAVEKMRQDQLARQKQSQLLEMAKTVDISTPEGAKQAFQSGLLDLKAYQDVQKAASDMALAKQRTETARTQAETSLRTASATERQTDARIAKWRSDSNLDAQRTAIERQKLQNTFDQQQIEMGARISRTLAGISDPIQRQAFYTQSLPILRLAFPDYELPENVNNPDLTAALAVFGSMGGKEQAPFSTIGNLRADLERGNITQAEFNAAVAKATTPPGRRITTSPNGDVIIEEGYGAPMGGPTSPVGATPQQSVVARNLNRLENIVLGEEGAVKQFFATGLPSATEALGQWTPAGIVNNLIKNVEANFTIQALQADRKNNPTGASSFGSLTEKEMEVVRQSLSLLKNSQTEEEFLRNLRETTDLYSDLTRGTPTEIVNYFLSGKVNPFDAADALKRKNPYNYTLSVPSLGILQNLPSTVVSSMSGMKARDQQTGQTIVIGQQPQPTPAGGGQGGVPTLSPAEASQLPSGSKFYGSDGVLRIKQ